MPQLSENIIAASSLQDRYRFTRKLATGGWCDIFQALDKSGRQVAVKMMRTESSGEKDGNRRVARFRREMQLSSRLRHPNIVEVLETGETDTGLLYIAFEYIEGPTLSESLKKHGALPIDTAMAVAMQVLDALGAAHQGGIVHRDLKPENILIVQNDARIVAKVLDFGISGLVPPQWDASSRLTLTREFLGTPSFASPEQLRGEPVGPKADIYAWGLTFLECLTGSSPFADSSVPAIVQHQLSPSPVPLPPLLMDHPLGTLLRWALEKEPARRAGSTSHLLDRLRSIPLEGIPQDNGYLPGPAPLTRQEESESPIVYRSQTPLAERRQISAICISLSAESSSDQASPDVVDEIYHDMQQFCLEKAKGLGGFVASDSGDRLLIYFGFPHASDTDSRRAIHAALALSNSLARRSSVLMGQIGLMFFHQIGMHTGMVTVRSSGQFKDRVTGMTPNIAAKLCSTASPNSILISEACRALLKDHVECEPAGDILTHPSSQVSPSYRVLGERSIEGLAGLTQASRGPMVGREFEHERIVTAWKGARDEGKGGTILLQGEAGMGKSRLASECAATIQLEGGGWFECRFTAESRSSALFGILESLKARIGLSGKGRPEAEQVAILEAKLADLRMPVAEAMPLLCAWLGFSSREYPLPTYSPQRIKALLLTHLASLLTKIAKESDSVIVLEDLQWIDQTSLELLPLLIEEAKKAGLLLLMSARPEFEPQLGAAEFETMQLGALDGRDAEKLIVGCLQGAPIADGMLYYMVERSGGVALFAFELARLYLERIRENRPGQAMQPGTIEIPNTLRDLLAGRLDRTGPAKETAQVAAALGRKFPFDILAKASWRDEALVLSDLDQLVSEGLLSVRLRVGNPEYQFQHALVRDAAYDSLAAKAKSDLHLRIANTLEGEFPEIAASQPEVFAMHWAGAGEYAKAVQYGLRVAASALQRSLYSQAIATASEAIEWAKKIEPPSLAAESELRLHQLLQPALTATQGFSADSVLRSVSRAEELSRTLSPDSELHFPVYWGLLLYYFSRPEYQKFSHFLGLAQAVAPDSGSVAALKAMEGHRAYSSADFDRALSLLDEAHSLYDPDKNRDHAQRFGHDTRVFALSAKSLVLTLVGRLEEAEAVIADALAWADELKSSHSQAMVRAYRLGIFHYRGDRKKTSTLADELVDFCSKHDAPIWLFPAHLLGGWAKNELERTVGSLAFCQQMGVNQFASYWQSTAAEIEIQRGEHSKALERLDKYIRQAEEIGEPFYVPELFRLRALCHPSSQPEKILEDLEASISTARIIGAGLTEARALEAKKDLLQSQP